MGIYTVDCRECRKPFSWFSGSRIQICLDCVKAAGGSEVTGEETSKDKLIAENLVLRKALEEIILLDQEALCLAPETEKMAKRIEFLEKFYEDKKTKTD